MPTKIRKNQRLKKLEKRKFSKTSGTLSGQHARLKVVKAYAGNSQPANISIKLQP